MNSNFEEDLENYTQIKLKAVAAFKEGKLEQALDYGYVAATYAWHNHLSIWYDDELEHLLAKAGERIRKDRVKQNPQLIRDKKRNDGHAKQDNIKSIVHIVSFLSDIGGHSEVLRQWINILADLVDNQYLYITNVSNVPLKYSYMDNFKSNGVKVRKLSYNNSYITRIEKLIEYFENDLPTAAILYINPNDVIAITALLSLSNRPYVIFFNHADHVFWLGRNTIDLLVEWRNESIKYSKKFRKIDKSYVIPLTTNIKPEKALKPSYGVPESSTLSVSIGSFYKFLGDPEWNYFETIERILKKFPNHYHLLVTNPPPKRILGEYLPTDPDIRKRFIIGGPFSNLEPIYGIADFLVESFPCVGGMVRVEAMACRLPIVAIKNKKFSLLSETDALPPNYPYAASTEEEVIEYSSKFIRSYRLRKQVGDELFRNYKERMEPGKIKNLWKNILKNREIDKEIQSSIQSLNFKKFNYDLTYAYLWKKESSPTKYLTNRALFIQTTMKQSTFSFMDRLKFYTRSLKKKELTGKELIGGAILIFTGRYGGAIFKSLLFKIDG